MNLTLDHIRLELVSNETMEFGRRKTDINAPNVIPFARSSIFAHLPINSRLPFLTQIKISPGRTMIRSLISFSTNTLSSKLSTPFCTFDQRRTRTPESRTSLGLYVSPIKESPVSPSRFISHSPSKPGRRSFPLRSCCMVPCLIRRFLAMSFSRDSIQASASPKASDQPIRRMRVLLHTPSQFLPVINHSRNQR